MTIVEVSAGVAALRLGRRRHRAGAGGPPRADPRRTGEAAICPVVRRVDADARRGAGHGWQRDGGPRGASSEPALGAMPLRPCRSRKRGPPCRRPATAHASRRPGSPMSDAAADRTSALAPAIEPAMPWLVSGWLAGVLLLSLRLLGGWWSTRVLRVVDVSPVPEWCRARRRFRRACDRPPGGDRLRSGSRCR